MKKILYIEGMSCQHCVNRVTKTLEAVKGISQVHVDLAENKAEVLAQNADEKLLYSAIDDAGYKLTHIQSIAG